MENERRISVVIPCYNGEYYIDQCIDALKKQTMSGFEVIVVDDGSRDNSLELLHKVTAGDPRFTVYHKENEGPVVARDYGMKRAKGEYLTFCDIDDYLPPRALEELFDAAEKTGADIVSGTFMMEYSGGKRKIKRGVEFEGLPGGEYVKLLLSGRAGWQMCGKLFKRALILENPIEAPANVVIGDDAAFTMQAASYARRVTSFNCPIYVYKQNEGSLMHQRDEKPYTRYFEAARFLERKGYGVRYGDYVSAFWLLSLSSASRSYGLSLDRAFVRRIASQHFTCKAINRIPFIKRCYVCLFIAISSIFGKKNSI